MTGRMSCVRGRLAERGMPLAREQLAECPADLMRGLKRPDDELLVAHEALEGLESAQDGVPLPREACCLESQDACARRREHVVPRAHLMRESIRGNIRGHSGQVGTLGTRTQSQVRHGLRAHAIEASAVEGDVSAREELDEEDARAARHVPWVAAHLWGERGGLAPW